MINFKIKIADLVFDINTIYEDTKLLCKDYIVDDIADTAIFINEDDLTYEKDKSDKEAIYEGRVPEVFTNGYLETISVYRKIAEYISNHNRCVFHGALIEKDGYGYLFTGRSGIGKTTHINNWLKMYPDCRIVNGDKPILKIDDNGVIGYGTPWSGKESLNNNCSVPIKAIIVLTRDTYNHIEQITINDCLSTLLSQIYRPNRNDGVKDALLMASKIGQLTSLYVLGCNMDIDSARVAYEGIK